jgi:hypothetical protein
LIYKRRKGRAVNMKKRRTNYVNNPDFYEALINYKQLCEQAKRENKQRPIVPNYIGACISSIANRLASKPNFSGYSYKEDMIMDGIENCLLYIDRFDPEKSENPFAYFTQIIWFAFLRRIAKEKKQLYIRFKSSQDMIALNGTYDQSLGENSNLNFTFDSNYIDQFIEEYEQKMYKKEPVEEKEE